MGARRGRPTVAIVLDGEERETLERWARRPKSSQGAGAAVPHRAGRGRGPPQQRDRCGAGVPSRDGVQVAPPVRRAPPRRALRRPAAGPAAHHRRRRRREGDRAHPGEHADGRDALVGAVDGQSGGHLAVVGACHLAGVRSQAPPRRGVQAVPGPAVHRQGPRTWPGCT